MSKRLKVPPIKGNPARKNRGQLGDNLGTQRGQPGPSKAPVSRSERTASEKFSSSQTRKRTHKKQAPRLKVTVQRPELIQALSEMLGLNKSAVINLALKVLAEREGLA